MPTIDRTALEIRVQRGLAAVLGALPAPLASRIAGHDLDIEGQVLDPHLALVLAMERRLNGAHLDVPVEERRAEMRKAARVAAGTPVPVGSVRDLQVDGAEGELSARLYSPEKGEGRPLVVFFHGGGWVVGDLDTHDQPCRMLCKHADVHVLAIDYRLAPEHPYPAGVDDACAAFAWALEHAAELGADPARVAVAGDSAGGNLAAVVSQHARDTGAGVPVAQLLIYPGTDASREHPSKNLFSDGYFLTAETMDWYVETYAGASERTDPRMSPLCHARHDGLPPTLVATAAFDPLRDEGEAYAAALRDAGVPVVLRRAQGLVHGYFSMTGVSRASRDETIAVIGAFSALLDTV